MPTKANLTSPENSSESLDPSDKVQQQPQGDDCKHILCGFYITGTCDRGEVCRYSHDLRIAEIDSGLIGSERGYVANPNAVNAAPKPVATTRHSIKQSTAQPYSTTKSSQGHYDFPSSTNHQLHDPKDTHATSDYMTLSVVNNCSVQELMLKAGSMNPRDSTNSAQSSLSSSHLQNRQGGPGLIPSGSMRSFNPLSDSINQNLSKYPSYDDGLLNSKTESNLNASPTTFVVTEHEIDEDTPPGFTNTRGNLSDLRDNFYPPQELQSMQENIDPRSLDFNFQKSWVYTGQSGFPTATNESDGYTKGYRAGSDAPGLFANVHEEYYSQRGNVRSPEVADSNIQMQYGSQTRILPPDFTFQAYGTGTASHQGLFQSGSSPEATSPFHHGSHPTSPAHFCITPNHQHYGIVPTGIRFSKHTSLPTTPDTARRHRMAATVAMTGFSSRSVSHKDSTPGGVSQQAPYTSKYISLSTPMKANMQQGSRGIHSPQATSEERRRQLSNRLAAESQRLSRNFSSRSTPLHNSFANSPSVPQPFRSKNSSSEFHDRSTIESPSDSSPARLPSPSYPRIEGCTTFQPPCESITKAIVEGVDGIIPGIDSDDEAIQFFGDAAVLFAGIDKGPAQQVNGRSGSGRMHRRTPRRGSQTDRRFSQVSVSPGNVASNSSLNGHLSYSTGGHRNSLRSPTSQNSAYLTGHDQDSSRSFHVDPPTSFDMMSTTPWEAELAASRNAPRRSDRSSQTHVRLRTRPHSPPTSMLARRRTQVCRSGDGGEAPPPIGVDTNVIDSFKAGPKREESFDMLPKKRSITQPPLPIGLIAPPVTRSLHNDPEHPTSEVSSVFPKIQQRGTVPIFPRTVGEPKPPPLLPPKPLSLSPEISPRDKDFARAQPTPGSRKRPTNRGRQQLLQQQRRVSWDPSSGVEQANSDKFQLELESQNVTLTSNTLFPPLPTGAVETKSSRGTPDKKRS